MSFNVQRRYMDVAFFNIEKKTAPPESNGSNIFLVILATVAVTVTVIGVAYCAGVKAGAINPICCEGALDFDFNFNG
ncbi:MAG: hypothetical protein R3C58_10875 [Parvularculaceae bacterium]